MALIQEDFQASVALAASLQRQLQEECASRRQAEEQALQYKQHLSGFAEFVAAELQHLQSAKISIKEDVAALLEEEEKWVCSLSRKWQCFWEDARVSPSEPIDKYEEGILQIRNTGKHEPKGIKEQIDKEETSCSATVAKGKYVESLGARNEGDLPIDDGRDIETMRETNMVDSLRGENQALLLDDSKEVLAQALTEKVATLLLLSQQEERHLLEKNVTVLLESQLVELKQRLVQVTSEKVTALMELAQLRQQFRELQDHERELNEMLQQHHGTNASGRLLPAIWAGTKSHKNEKSFVQHEKEIGKKVPSGGYLKSWLRGLELPISKSSTSCHDHSVRSNTFKKEDESFGVARLRVENAGLQECLTSIRRLSNAATRLRLTIVKVAAESNIQSENSVQTAIEVVDGAISEVQRLKIAFGSSLPVSYSGWTGIDSPTPRESEIVPEDTNVDVTETPDVASVFGMEIIELVLLAAELQKTGLIQKLNAVRTV